MKTIINTSTVTDYSGETPVVTDSNPVETIIRQTPPAPIITRIFYTQICDCGNFCNCCCDCPCDCDCCCDENF